MILVTETTLKKCTESWKHPMVQLDPMKTVLALSHSDNTIEKTMFLEERYGHIGRTVHEFTLDAHSMALSAHIRRRCAPETGLPGLIPARKPQLESFDALQLVPFSAWA